MPLSLFPHKQCIINHICKDIAPSASSLRASAILGRTSTRFIQDEKAFVAMSQDDKTSKEAQSCLMNDSSDQVSDQHSEQQRSGRYDPAAAQLDSVQQPELSNEADLRAQTDAQAPQHFPGVVLTKGRQLLSGSGELMLKNLDDDELERWCLANGQETPFTLSPIRFPPASLLCLKLSGPKGNQVLVTLSAT